MVFGIFGVEMHGLGKLEQAPKLKQDCIACLLRESGRSLPGGRPGHNFASGFRQNLVLKSTPTGKAERGVSTS